MGNFRQDIEEWIPKDETIIRIEVLSDRYGMMPHKETVIDETTWDGVAPQFDYEYDEGYGSQDCHMFYAWTQTMIIYLALLGEGMTNIASVPRNPPVKTAL